MSKFWERIFKREQAAKDRMVNDMRSAGGMLANRGVAVGRGAVMLTRPPAARYRVTIESPILNHKTGRRELLAVRTAHNLVTTVGATDIVSVYFKASTGPGTFYLTIIKGASAPTLANADTSASHAGWTEIAGSDVQEANRQAFTLGSVSAGSVDNSASKAVYTGNANWTAQGLAIINQNTIGGSTGVLYSEAAFAEGSAAMQVGYLLTVQGTVGMTPG